MAGGRGLAAALDMSSDDIGSIAFPYSHIAGPDYLLMMLSAGFAAVLIEAFVPSEAVATYRDLGVTMCGGSTAFYQMFLGEQRKSPDTKVIPTLRIISGGGAAKPAELLYAHPKVGDVAVIGLPDAERGELVCAVVEPPAGGEVISFDEMVAHLGDAGLMRQKIPERLEVVDKLPRNETLNKVLKYKLREQFA